MSEDEKKKELILEEEARFKELLARLLPEVLEKLMGEGGISIPLSCIEQIKDMAKDGYFPMYASSNLSKRQKRKLRKEGLTRKGGAMEASA